MTAQSLPFSAEGGGPPGPEGSVAQADRSAAETRTGTANRSVFSRDYPPLREVMVRPDAMSSAEVIR